MSVTAKKFTNWELVSLSDAITWREVPASIRINTEQDDTTTSPNPDDYTPSSTTAVSEPAVETIHQYRNNFKLTRQREIQNLQSWSSSVGKVKDGSTISFMSGDGNGTILTAKSGKDYICEANTINKTPKGPFAVEVQTWVHKSEYANFRTGQPDTSVRDDSAASGGES